MAKEWPIKATERLFEPGKTCSGGMTAAGDRDPRRRAMAWSADMNDRATESDGHLPGSSQPPAIDPSVPIASAGELERQCLALARTHLKCLVQASLYDKKIDPLSAGVAETVFRLIGKGQLEMARYLLRWLSSAS